MTEIPAVTTGLRPYGEGNNSYKTAGEYEGIARLVDAFYTAMETLPEAAEVLAMHTSDLQESRKKLTYFLSGWLGGPRLYRETYGPIVIPSAHRHLSIGIAERDAWLLCMRTALDQQCYPDDFKAYLLEQLYRPAELSRTRD